MPDTNDADRTTIARLADEVLPTLIERLIKSELGELEVRENGWRVRLRRVNGQAPEEGHAVPVSVSARSSTAGHTTHAASDGHAARREPPRGLISSPAVGYFVARDGLSVGANLRRGDVLGAVDVLGMRQDVVSPIDGVLRALEVESGGAVEYGQLIGRVEAGVQ